MRRTEGIEEALRARKSRHGKLVEGKKEVRIWIELRNPNHSRQSVSVPAFGMHSAEAFSEGALKIQGLELEL